MKLADIQIGQQVSVCRTAWIQYTESKFSSGYIDEPDWVFRTVGKVIDKSNTSGLVVVQYPSRPEYPNGIFWYPDYLVIIDYS